MSDTMKTLPAPLAALLARLPPYPACWAFVQGLNRLLAPQLPDDVRALLQGRSLRLRVLDAGVAVDFCWRGAAFAPARHGPAPDLSIGAQAQLAACQPAGACDGYWHGQPGMEQHAAH